MSSGSQQAGNITTTQAPAPYMQPYIGTALGQANSLLAGGGPNYYTGNTVAGFSQPQQEAMAGIQNLGMNGTPPLGAANRFDTMLLNGGGSNPWLDRTFNQAADSTQNRLASEYAGSGMDVRNSAPLRAQQLNNLATDIYGGNYNNTLNAALNAGNQAQSLYGTQMSGLNAAQGVGQQVQNQAQQLIDASRGAYNYNQMQPYQNLQQYETYLGGVSPGMSTQSPYFTNPTANALGTAMGGLGAYNAGKTAGLWGSGKGASSGAASGAAASDRRLKTDIHRIGKTDGGLPVYTFRYHGNPTVMMGVMSDDVRKKQPEAVIQASDGYDRVYYGMLK